MEGLIIYILVGLISGIAGTILGVFFVKPTSKVTKKIIFFFRKIFHKPKLPMKNPELFHFGNLNTSWTIVDGGIEGGRYTSETIKTYFDQRPLKLTPDLQKLYQKIQKREEEKRQRGESFLWNGQRYYLNRFVTSRTSLQEYIALDLWFGPADYYTFQATQMSLDEKIKENKKLISLREKYLKNIKWDKPVEFFSNSFSINLGIITEDNYLILTQRGENLGSRPGVFNISVCEGINRLDRKVESGAPNMFSTALRGIGEEIAEELGLLVNDDIIFLSFGVDIEYSQWGLLGMVRVNATKDQIIQWRASGVKDKWENIKLYFIPFRIEDVIKFVYSESPWGPAALCCIYHILIHEFARSEVNTIIERYNK